MDKAVVISRLSNNIAEYIANESITPDYFEAGDILGIDYSDDEVDFGTNVIKAVDKRVTEMMQYMAQYQVLPLPRTDLNERKLDLAAYDFISRFGDAGEGVPRDITDSIYSVLMYLQQALEIEFKTTV